MILILLKLLAIIVLLHFNIVKLHVIIAHHVNIRHALVEKRSILIVLLLRHVLLLSDVHKTVPK